jgi:hypothetical protein
VRGQGPYDPSLITATLLPGCAAGSGEDIVVHIKAHAIMRRKELGVAKTRGANLRWDKSVGFLVGGRSDGVNRMQAFARTAGTSVVTFLQGQQ